MNWIKTLQKAGLAVLTFGAAYLASNPAMIVNLVPKDIEQMTVGSLLAAIVVGLANWLKHKSNK